MITLSAFITVLASRRATGEDGGWRYEMQIYAFPIELKAAQRMIKYLRPETTGF